MKPGSSSGSDATAQRTSPCAVIARACGEAPKATSPSAARVERAARRGDPVRCLHQ